jgi:hypothetical protein
MNSAFIKLVGVENVHTIVVRNSDGKNQFGRLESRGVPVKKI